MCCESDLINLLLLDNHQFLPNLLMLKETPEYEVEEILDSRLKRGKLEYLVKWSGYTNDYNTWKSEANCALPILLAIFIKRILLPHKNLALVHSLD